MHETAVFVFEASVFKRLIGQLMCCDPPGVTFFQLSRKFIKKRGVHEERSLRNYGQIRYYTDQIGGSFAVFKPYT